jgi:hypothetical protein
MAMKKIAPRSASLTALQAFTESDDDGAFRLFARLCRASPALREWLWEEFARKPKTRAKLASALARKDTEDDAAVFSVESHSLRIEAAALREKVPARIYGGLTWNEVEVLVRHYQAGKLDLGTFLLVNEWRHKNSSSEQSPRLTLASVEWFGQVVREGETRLLRHVGKTLRFLASLEKAPKRRGLFGHTDWWKLNVLFYMLRHPRESYRTRDFRAHLAELGIEIGAKDIRRFCKNHNIRRDMRAGRPQKS